MPNFVSDNTALPDTKVDRRPIPPGGSTVNFISASDFNAVMTGLDDVRDWIRAATWYGLATNAADPAPAGITNYIWLKTDGTLWKTVNGVASQIGAGGGGITNSAGANVIPKSDGTNIVASSLTDNGTTVTSTVPVTITDGDDILFSSRNGASGSRNIWIGGGGTVNTSGATNVALGQGVTPALNANTTGNANVAVGTAALTANTTGSRNCAFGTGTLEAATTANDQVAIGWHALIASNASNNVGIGTSALAALTSGASNVAIGMESMATGVVTGDSNVGIGVNTLKPCTSGNANVAIGPSAMQATTTGYSNVANGQNALFANVGGFRNVCLGPEVQQNSTSAFGNVSIGYQASNSDTTGSENVCIGYSCAGPSTGHYNVLIGAELSGVTTGGNNTIIGAQISPTAAASNRVIIGAGGASGVRLFMGQSGTPEGAVTAPVGSMYLRTDGGAGTTLYIKESGAGNVGWVAK